MPARTPFVNVCKCAWALLLTGELLSGAFHAGTMHDCASAVTLKLPDAKSRRSLLVSHVHAASQALGTDLCKIAYMIVIAMITAQR